MTSLSLSQGLDIAQAAMASGKTHGFKPLTVAVLDAGGHIVVVLRDDNSSLLRPEIAVGKAWGVLGMGFGGRELARRAEKTPQFFSALSDMSGGRMVPVQGGVIVRNASGAILGSVGISGDTSANDEICAIAGIEAAGLIADAG
ncbi:MAG: heme-binding protein [Hoeflea sp.]|uniref:GlcG/HbpS family heme-binding protein n=1 Tax=Hoeflea sp. TaxID=1940281 RepID=UPI001D73E9E2|nr:heme-binding protein [Hoeflea sp.]MBU4528997.1 heme-binding protein [Alphaproteobacteria bacterium]MBU4543402.1 heme-binding protein [Alphaproteobacteria bacterium]MBU4549027.1 heme-binding protein [Alphaproteobacteria bacterium]MBV1725162.1 heme-binding protein [Hoeflea sp.]MBV1785123.1 heme-binding protein [Hoeflea sp.]